MHETLKHLHTIYERFLLLDRKLLRAAAGSFYFSNYAYYLAALFTV